MATGSYLSIITLNLNGLNAPTKRQRLAEWIQKQDPYICCLQETHLKTGDTYRLKVKGCKRYSMQIETKRKQEQQYSYQIKQTLKQRLKKRQRRTLHNDQRINPRRRYNNYKYICTQHRSTTQYVRQMLTSMKGEINNNTIIVGDFNTPLTPMDK